MKNLQKGFIVPLLLALIVIVIIGGGIYYYYTKSINSTATPAGQTSSSNTSSSSPQDTTNSNSGLSTYDNFGISFNYPAEWGVPTERIVGNNSSEFISFNDASYNQLFSASIEQDTGPDGSLINETFDQMIARYRANDEYIYQVKDVMANGLQGKELFYKSAVTGKPYEVGVYFPFQNNSYISLYTDYQFTSLSTFDSIISTLKKDSDTIVKKDSATGMTVYKNNGIKFEYPDKFNTNYASLIVGISIEKADVAKLDSNGCYSTTNDSGKPSSDSVLTINGVKFCATSGGGVGAGQATNIYYYTTLRNGNAYSIYYSVGTSNGCGAYENSSDPNDPANKQYNECLAFQKSYDSIVTKPIKDSIATFTFTN